MKNNFYIFLKSIVLILCLSIFLCGCTNKKNAGPILSINEFAQIAGTGTPKEVNDAVKKIKNINEIFILNDYQMDIMTVAARNTKYPEVIDIFAENGAEMNFESDIGTPLIVAIMFNSNPNIFKEIMKNGGNPYPALNYNGEKIKTPANLDYSYMALATEAMWNDNPKVLEEVLKIPEVKNSVKKNEWMLFFMIANNPENTQENAEEKVKILVKNGYDINAKNSHGKTALEIHRDNKNKNERTMTAIKVLEKYSN